MKTEENNRMEVLACIIADLKAENMMLTERVHPLTDDYNKNENFELLYNELTRKNNSLENLNKDLRKQRDEQEEHINRINNAEFVEMGQECQYNYKSLQKTKRKVGDGECYACSHMMKADVFGKKCVLCAYLYDNKKEHDAREMMATDE